MGDMGALGMTLRLLVKFTSMSHVSSLCTTPRITHAMSIELRAQAKTEETQKRQRARACRECNS